MILFKYKGHLGYTLNELLFTMALVGLLFFLSLPYINNFLNRNELDKRINTLSGAIKFARNQAIILGEPLVLSKLSENKNWQKGMQLSYSKSKDNKVIRRWHWHDKRLDIQWKGFKQEDHLVFTSDLNNLSLSGSFLLSERSQLKRKIVINRLGRVRIEHIS